MARLSYIVIIGIALMCVLAEELYSDRFDNVDVSSILQNDKLREEYYNCYMEKDPCLTEDAKFFQGIMSEVIQTNCKKCTERQKEMFTEIKNWFKQNKLEQWDALVAKSVEDMKKKNADS
ncbi:ejaculatory bulb-specific protein 3-like [Mycetomoellerius zeteki]|uniref:ejaculatory bulb-specific protein 3-like n=1 Tax=Mycetomoellerius zeteki TaxID=64791 RepID=UPI00084E48BB|nr:PREDICTED: ejaculatory bulb-specific protein 3-like [Trachymyrmex zeteki]